MAFFTGTLLASPIVRGSSGDTYGTHYSILGVGGYMEVETLTDRNNLPIRKSGSVGILDYDKLSSGQRRYGMLVYVAENDTTYQLKPSYSTWTGSTDIVKTTLLENNTNWIVYKDLNNISGGTGSGTITGATNLNIGFSGTTVSVLEMNFNDVFYGDFVETLTNHYVNSVGGVIISSN